MIYRHANVKEFCEDLSSGRVLYNAPGLTAFPVRLASEIAQRCFVLLEAMNSKPPYSIYDPCCGGAYLLTVLGFLHPDRFEKLIASDCQDRALAIARKNLSLLQAEGIKRRIKELETLAGTYHKDSHIQALQSAKKLCRVMKFPPHVDCFKANFMDAKKKPELKADLVITDFPYGSLTFWEDAGVNPIDKFFDNAAYYLKPGKSVLAIIADKGQKLKSISLKRIEYFKTGKRQIGLFLPVAP